MWRQNTVICRSLSSLETQTQTKELTWGSKGAKINEEYENTRKGLEYQVRQVAYYSNQRG